MDSSPRAPLTLSFLPATFSVSPSFEALPSLRSTAVFFFLVEPVCPDYRLRTGLTIPHLLFLLTRQDDVASLLLSRVTFCCGSFFFAYSSDLLSRNFLPGCPAHFFPVISQSLAKCSAKTAPTPVLISRFSPTSGDRFSQGALFSLVRTQWSPVVCGVLGPAVSV